MMKNLFVLAGLLFGFSTQAQHVVKAAVAKGNPTQVEVKWFAPGLYHEEGFVVYRQEGGAGEWTRLTTSPVMKQAGIEPSAKAADKELKSFEVAINKAFPKPLAEQVVLFVLLKSVQSEAFASFLGIRYQDASTVAGKRYVYKVMKLNKGKEELIGLSNGITSGQYLPEAAPQDFTITARKNQIGLNWKPEPQRLYAFNLYRSESATGNFKKLNKRPILVFSTPDKSGKYGIADLLYKDDSITNGKTYYYQLAGLDVFGNESEYTKVLSSSPLDGEPPLPVSGLKVKNLSKKVSLTWKASTSADVAGYRIYVSENNNRSFRSLNDSALVKGLQFEYLVPRPGNWYFKVHAVDQSGNESEATHGVLEVADDTPPPVPTGLKATAEPGVVRLNWDQVKCADWYGYYVLRAANQDKPEFYVRVKGPEWRNNFYIDSVPKEAGNLFYYRVLAIDSTAIESAWSEPVSLKQPDVIPPPAPLITSVKNEGGKVSVSWMSVLCDDLAGYQLYRSVKGDSLKFELLPDGNLSKTVLTYQDATAPAGLVYYQLRAKDESGNLSGPSNAFPSGNKIKVSKLSAWSIQGVYQAASKQVSLNWKMPTESSVNGIIVYKAEQDGSFYPVSSLLKSGTWEDKQVKPGNTYRYEARVLYQNGEIQKSEPLIIQINN